MSDEPEGQRRALISSQLHHSPLPFLLPGNLVSEPLARNDGNVLTYTLVSMEIMRESRVVFLDDDTGRFFDRFRSHASLGKMKARSRH